MTKPRKKLTDTLAEEFVYGKTEPASLPEPTISIDTTELVEPISPPNITKEKSILSKLLETEPKEATIRFTVDMPESMHRKLSILAARSSKKKAVIVRLLLESALDEVED